MRLSSESSSSNRSRRDLGLPPSGKSRRSFRTPSLNEKTSDRFLIDHYADQSNIGSMRTSRPSSEKIYSTDSMIVSGGCLKRGRSSDCSRKKSVRFDCQSPSIVRMNSTPSLIDEEKKTFVTTHREEKKFQINSFQTTRIHLNHIEFCPNPATITISTDQLESFEPFFLSPPSPTTTTQTSTLIISTPPQFHYYLYPSSTRSSNTNGSVNSISTTSSSSNDFDDETCSSSTSSSSNHRSWQRNLTKKFSFQGETTFESYRELFRDKPRRNSSSNNDFQSKRQFFENQIYVDQRNGNVNRPSRPESLIRTTIKRRGESASTMNMTKTIDFLRDIYPQSDELRSIAPTDDLNEQIERWKEQQRIHRNQEEINRKLGNQLIEMFESHADQREIEKFRLHLNEIDTITSVLLKLSSRWSKIENDLHKCSDEKKTLLIEQREKIRKKHDEAKFLKEGIDRRTRSIRNFLRKYFNDEQCENYEYFIRMKSKLMVEAKRIEEEIFLLEKRSKELFSGFDE